MTTILRAIPPLPHTERGRPCAITDGRNGELLIYCQGSDVIIRSFEMLLADVEPLASVITWKGHTKQTTIAVMSPNGNWMCSGDVTGAIRVWGSKGEQIQKAEYTLWSGEVKDVQWSADSTRIAACGDGSGTKAVAIIMDTGSKTGEISGHGKVINSISFKGTRPFRVMTGSDDMTVSSHEGPPFKWQRSHNGHTNFVLCVRYSPDGEWAFSTGSDSKLFLYTGTDCECVREFEPPAGITGSLYRGAWSPDSRLIATAGGDKKLRIWGREAGAQLAEVTIGEASLDDMQLGITWPKQNLLATVCFDSRLLLWEVQPDGSAVQPKKCIDGTTGKLDCVSFDAKTQTLVYAGSAGMIGFAPLNAPIFRYKVGVSVTHLLAHSFGSACAGEIWAVGRDDLLRCIGLEKGEDRYPPAKLPEAAMGIGFIDGDESMVIVAGHKGAAVCVGAGGILWEKPGVFPRRPTALASLPRAAGAGGLVAVGIEKPPSPIQNNCDIMVFDVNDPSSDAGFVARGTLEHHQSQVMSLKFNASGELLASTDSQRNVILWDVAAGAVKIIWTTHTASVTALDWLPGTNRLVTGGLDRRICVWEPETAVAVIKLEQVHKGQITAVAAMGEKQFVSVGEDGFVLVHEIQ